MGDYLLAQCMPFLLLPFVLLLFGNLCGVKGDFMVRVIGELSVAIIKGLFLVFAGVLKAVVEATQIFLMAKAMNGQQRAQVENEPRRSKVKVTVMDED